MAITHAIPALWSARIKQQLFDALVFGQVGVVNRDYEGELAGYGSSVKVIDIAPVTIKTYTSNVAIAVPDTLTDDDTTLTIDEARYFNFAIDDIDAAQTRPKLMDEATRTAAWGLRDAADTDIAAEMIANGTEHTASPVAVHSTEGALYDVLVDLDVHLTENNIPSNGRWVAMSPACHGILRKDDRFIHETVSGDSVIANGNIGQAAGFTIIQSNKMPEKASNPYVIAGHAMATSFVDQVDRVEAYRPDDFFADALRGLYVWGTQVMRPEAVVYQDVDITA